MARPLVLFFLCLIFYFSGQAQTVGDTLPGDSSRLKRNLPGADSARPALLVKKPVHPVTDSLTRDSLRRAARKRTVLLRDSLLRRIKQDSLAALPPPVRTETVSSGNYSFRQVLALNPYVNFNGRSSTEPMEIHVARSYDSIFYLLVGILFYFALIRAAFIKYLNNLFTLFFRVSLRQQQIREQVLQTPLPSLLLNILFLVSGGLYITFLIRFYLPDHRFEFWALLVNAMLVLLLVYLVKFLLLKLTGWVFNISRATDTYIFVVFLANKVLGIFLLPFLLFLSFPGALVRQIAIAASLLMIGCLLIYRFVVSFNPIRKEIKVKGFHFFLYICAFELAPLLLIYKVLLSYLEKAY